MKPDLASFLFLRATRAKKLARGKRSITATRIFFLFALQRQAWVWARARTESSLQALSICSSQEVGSKASV